MVTEVGFGYAVSVTTDRGTRLTIETAFTIHTASGGAQLVHPENVTRGEPLQSLVGQWVRHLSVTDGGRLVVGFSGGETIVVEPDGDYEAWGIRAPNGFQVIALPGGGVAVWDANVVEQGGYTTDEPSRAMLGLGGAASETAQTSQSDQEPLVCNKLERQTTDDTA
nr:DUF6188 family protein [Prescottella agglutinans]